MRLWRWLTVGVDKETHPGQHKLAERVGDFLDRLGLTIAAFSLVGGWISESFAEGKPEVGVVVAGVLLAAAGAVLRYVSCLRRSARSPTND